MTAMSVKTRGYLSQLAEPVPQGEPEFSARRDLLTPSAQVQPQIPLIEDVVVYRNSRPPSSTLTGAQIIQAPVKRDVQFEFPSVARLIGETASLQSSIRINQDNEGVFNGTYVSPSSASKNRTEGLERSTTQDIEFNTNDSSRSSESNTARPVVERHDTRLPRESSVQASDASNLSQKAKGASFSIETSNDYPAQRMAAIIESMPSTESKRSESSQNTEARTPDAQGNSAPRNLFNNQRTLRDEFANLPRQSARSGPRVVIGTVEIRTRISQPAPVAVLPAQRIAERNSDEANLHGGATPARLDSLVRSLGWNFGLIQG
jgi:hypothetical protein